MIRKLRWKFVAVCMGLVALVLSAVFGAAYHAVRQNIEDLSRQMLYQVLREDSGRGAVPNPTIEIGGDRVLLPYFTVNIWGDTAYITGGTYADLENTDTLRDILSQCLEQGAAEGTVSEYHLRYLSMDNGLYRKLAFVDMSMEQAVLRRLISILLDNAVKYGAEGGHITLTLEKMDRQARLTVSNPGDPIPPEHLAHLFERFYRTDASRGEKSGFGLGLANADTIAREHKGMLQAS